MRRFAGFRFLETGYYDLVGPLLGGVEIRRPKDYLASAFAMIKAENLELASQVIEEFSNIQWPGIRAGVLDQRVSGHDAPRLSEGLP